MSDSLLYENRGADLRPNSALSNDRPGSRYTPHSDNGTTTTTISTIAVKSGETRIIIALLQCGSWIHLKVIELTPDLTLLGETLDEAETFQRDHDDVLNKLQTKQSPVEELLKQADQLISSQKPKAEIYAAMAENLGLAWKDLNSQLEYRKQILDRNVAFKRRTKEFSERMNEAEMTFKRTCLSRDAPNIKDDLSLLHEVRKSMLTALMLALQEGQSLQDKLREIEEQASIDSRPNKLQPGLNNAINRVERWMEELHDRRRSLEEQWTVRKKALEQGLASALLIHDLDELQHWLNTRGHEILQIVELGSSSPDTELLLHEHSKIENEVKDVQARGIRLMKTADQLITSGRCTDEEPRRQAFSLLDQISELAGQIERRQLFLKETLKFFRESQLAQTKLCQLEIRLSSADLPGGSNQMAQLYARTVEVCDDTALPVIRQGQELEESVGRGAPGTKGLSDGIQEIITAYERVMSMCHAHREVEMKKEKELQGFYEYITTVESWLENVCDAFLQVKQDMGRDLQTAEEFLNLQRQLLKDLMTKRDDIEILSRDLPHLEVGNLNEVESLDRRLKGVSQHWKQLKQTMEARADISEAYVQVHSLAVNLTQQLDNLERTLRTSTKVTEKELQGIEEAWMKCQQEYLQLQVAAKHFSNQSGKVLDPHLDIRGAKSCVDNILERLGNRQLIVTREWQTLETSITTRKEVIVEWAKLQEEVTQTTDRVTKLSSDLYPMIPSALHSPGDIVNSLESQLSTTIPDLQRAQSELELRMKTSELLSTKGDPENSRKSLIQDLNKSHSLLTQRIHDYQSLLGDTIGYFRNVQELQKMVDRLYQQTQSSLPDDMNLLENAMKEHEVCYQTGREMFRIAQDDAMKIIVRIKEKEPPEAASQDEAKVHSIVTGLSKDWNELTSDFRRKIDQELKYSHFNIDLKQINLQLQELNDQLRNLKGQYGESLNSAKATSMAFGHFENTITVLEKRIKNFVSTAQTMMTGQKDPTGHVQIELNSLQNKWSTLQRQVGESRHSIDLSIEYFTLVEESEEWFKSGSKLLITLARRSTNCKVPGDAKSLLQEVNSFLEPGEEKQRERLKKISSLAVQLYGQEQPKHIDSVNKQNEELLESFTSINSELHNLVSNLETTQVEKDRQKREKEAIEADLAAARADAEAAKAAAAASEEARKAAEAISRSVLSQQSTVTTATTVERLEESIEKRQEMSLEVTKDIYKSPTPTRKLPETPAPVAPKFIQGMDDLEVEEGSKVTLRCLVKGVPVPTVNWYKDGMSIESNPDYLTSFDKGQCTLTIEETFVEDSATFTCKAVNAGGIAETNALLKVKEAQVQDELLPPEFAKYLEAKIIKEDEVCELEAQVLGNPLPVVTWFKDSVCIDHISEYNITYNNGNCSLRLLKAMPQHQGMYTIKASNPLGNCQSSARITIHSQIKTNIPEFNVPLSNVMARAGQKLRLECKLKTDPDTQVAWLHNGRPIRETRELKLQYDGERALLVIMEAFPKDAGTYVIIAKNSAGEASSSCNVSVKGRLPAESSDSEVFSDMEPVKPSVQVQLPDITVKEGEKVRMDCVIVGQPEPEVIWYHNDQPVKESSDFQLLFQGDRCSLLIQEAFREDAGSYRVVAINSAGEAKNECFLTVRTPEDVLGPTEAPKFEKLLSDVTCKEGKDVTMNCIVSGQPEPNVTWYKDEKQIHPSSDFLFKHEKSGQVSLHIPEIFLQDGGVYMVKATNLSGEAKCYCTLKVDPRSPKEERKTKALPPKFIQLFRDRTVYEGKPVRFDCVVSGTPKPKVIWMFNQEIICPLDYKMQGTVTGDKYSLYISESELSFNGRISCVAENEAGKATCSALLTVYESSPPQPVEQPPVLTNGYSSVITKSSVYEESSIIEHDTETKQSIPTHHEASQLDCHTKQVTNEEPEYAQSLKRAELHHNVGDDSFQIHHQTSTLHIKGDRSTEIVTKGVYSPSKSTITPKFVIPLPAKVIEEGKKLVMEGTLEGLPQPTVNWFKDDVELSPNNNIQTTYDGLKVKLVIEKPSVSDSGRYKCVANNLSGTATSIADLIVKEHLAAPFFSIPLQAKLCHVGEDVTLEAHVKGAPSPTITWEKDDAEIHPSERVEVSVDHTKHTLRIRSATLSDTGSYLIRAVNPAGEARCIADLIIDEPVKQTYTISRVSVSKEAHLEKEKHNISDTTTPFEPFPDLEPFPYTPDPPKPRGVKLPMVGMPSKFIPKPKSPPHESIDGTVKIPPIWRPVESDSEENPSYKKVKLPATPAPRKSLQKKDVPSPDPPSKFDTPPKFDGPPRPVIDFQGFVASNIEAKEEIVTGKRPIVKTFTQQHILKDSESIEYTQKIVKKSSEQVDQLPHPGPPPEIGYFSKGNSPVGDSIKSVKAIRNKLEKMHSEELRNKAKCPEEIPGAVKLFPSRSTRSHSLEPQTISEMKRTVSASAEKLNHTTESFSSKITGNTLVGINDKIYTPASSKFVPRYTSEGESKFYSEDEGPKLLKKSSIVNKESSKQDSSYANIETTTIPMFYESVVTGVKEEKFSSDTISKVNVEADTKSHTFLCSTESVLIPSSKTASSEPGVVEQHLLKPSDLAKSRIWPPPHVQSICPEGKVASAHNEHDGQLLDSGKQTPKSVRLQIPDTLTDFLKSTPKRKVTPASHLFLSPEMRKTLELEDEQDAKSQALQGCSDNLASSQLLSTSQQVFPQKSSIFSDKQGSEMIGITSGSMLAPCPVDSVEKSIQLVTERVESESNQEEFKVSSVSISRSPVMHTSGKKHHQDVIKDTFTQKTSLNEERKETKISSPECFMNIPIDNKDKPLSISQLRKITPDKNSDVINIPHVHEAIKKIEDTSFQESSSSGTRFVSIQKSSNLFKIKDSTRIASQTSPVKQHEELRKPVSLAAMGRNQGKLVIDTVIDIPKEHNVSLTHTLNSPEPPVRPPPPSDFSVPPAKPKRFYPKMDKSPQDTNKLSDSLKSHNIYKGKAPMIKDEEVPRVLFRPTTPPLEPGPPVEVGYVSRLVLPTEPSFSSHADQSYSGKKNTTHTTEVIKTHFDNMSNKFVSKVKKFGSQVSQEVHGSEGKPEQQVHIQTSSPSQMVSNESFKTPPKSMDGGTDTSPQVYREESRAVDFGSKHIDPDTGLIYFKYDFGYEFGIVSPGPKAVAAAVHEKRNPDDVQVNVINEKSTIPFTNKASEKNNVNTSDARVKLSPKGKFKHFPNFRPKKFSQFKAVKWEPTSESEASDFEFERPSRRRHASMTERSNADMCWQKSASSEPNSPWLRRRHSASKEEAAAVVSAALKERTPDRSTRISPLRITSPYMDLTSNASSSHIPSGFYSGKSPIFCQPLREIAIGMGQPLKLDCIVQGEPLPNIQWYKDGKPVNNSPDFQISQRDGVCSLVIPEVYKEDSGVYSCTATNALGSVSTTTSIFVSGERR